MRIVRRRKRMDRNLAKIKNILRAWSIQCSEGRRKNAVITNVRDTWFPRQCSNATGKEEALTGNVSLWSRLVRSYQFTPLS